MQSYINENRQKRKKLAFKIKICGSFIFLSLFIIGVVYLIIYSPLLQIKNINSVVLEGDIRNFNEIISDLNFFFAARSRIASILGAGNILIWENQAEDFLKYQPAISSLTIRKDYFKRTVDINIEGRKKFGVFCSIIECWWFDKKGVVFEKASRIEGEIIYNINDLSNRKLEIGERILPQNFFDNAIKIFEVMEEIGFNIRTLNIDDLELQEAHIESLLIPKIYFSLRFAPKFNNDIFKNFKEIGLQKIEYIDLRVENRIYYKLK